MPRVNMKIHFLGLLGLLALCLQGTQASPTYVGSTTHWTQGQRRAVSPDGGFNGPSTSEELLPQQLPLKLAPSPMNPFLNLRPFLPVKPTFMPPFIDPQIFVDKKTAFLNSLFGIPSAADNSVNTTTTSSQPLIWAPAASPNYFAQKKTQFLNTLFSSLAAQSSAPSPQQAKRDLPDSSQYSLFQSPPSSDSSLPAITSNPFTDKKTAFLEKLFAALSDGDNVEAPTTAKPTIVPPGFWVPSAVSAAPLARVPLMKTPPVVVDPNFFVEKKTKFLNTLFSNLAVTPKTMGVPTTKASIVPPNYWIPPGKPDTTTLYQQKVSEFLDKLFKSLNTTSDPASIEPSNIDSTISKDDIDSNDIKISSVKPRFVGSPMGMWGPPPFAPAVNPKFFIDKKTEFLNKLFTSLSTPATNEAVDPMSDPAAYMKPTIVPPNFWSPFPSGGASAVDGSSYAKPTVVPPNFWSPFASTTAGDSSTAEKPIPAADPSLFINNKAQFLNSLFNNLGISPKTDATIQSQTQETSKTTGTTDTSGTNNAILADLIERLVLPEETTDIVSKRNNDHERDGTQLKDASLEDPSFNTDSLSRRSVAMGMKADNTELPNSPLLVAKDKVVNSIIAELGGIKNEMMTTVDEILKQKKQTAEQAAAVNPFNSFGMKSPYGFGGGKMFGSGMKGTGKKGDTSATEGKKKTGSPFGGKFPFWAPPPAAKPTPDPTAPLQERLEFLNQVFEMLTKLQQDVSAAVNEANNEVMSHTTASPVDEDDVFNVMKKMMAKGVNSTDSGKKKLNSREVDNHPVTSNPLPPNVVPEESEDDKTRSIKMAVHQGYQSLPPGTEEVIETGGGSETDEHEGGGLKLQIKVPV